MIIRLNNSLVNLSNMTSLDKIDDKTVTIHFTDKTKRQFDCPFEDLAYHLGFRAEGDEVDQGQEEDEQDDSSEESA